MAEPIKIIKWTNGFSDGVLIIHSVNNCILKCNNSETPCVIDTHDIRFVKYDCFSVILKTTDTIKINSTYKVDYSKPLKFIFGRAPGQNYYFMINDFAPKNFANFRATKFFSAFKSDKLKALSYVIAKSGCSTIINSFIRADLDPDYPATAFPWDCKFPIKSAPNYKKIRDLDIFVSAYNVEKTSQYDDYIKFVVLRDPIAKFISICNYGTTCPSLLTPFRRFYINLSSNDKSIWIDFCLQLARINQMVNNILLREQHLDLQISELKYITKLDYYVRLKDLQKFYIEKFNFEAPIVNESKNKLISIDDLSESQLEQINEIYKPDIDFIKTVNFWKPSN